MAHSTYIDQSIHEMLQEKTESVERDVNESDEGLHINADTCSIVPFRAVALEHPTPQNQTDLVWGKPTAVLINSAHNLDGSVQRSTASRIDSIKNWSICTYKCTRQMMLEKMGRSHRTIDIELETRIEQLRETHRKYLSVLRLARTFSSHFHHVVATQQMLADSFADLGQKNPELQKEFACNSEMQRMLTKNGEMLLNALNFFITSIHTLCYKTIDDTLLTIRQYETARVEFDAYRMDFENTKVQDIARSTRSDTEEAHKTFLQHKELYEKLKADVAIKMQFLSENRIKVMHKQLILLHNAIAAYFSGNAKALDATLKQFNIKLRTNFETGLWLEH